MYDGDVVFGNAAVMMRYYLLLLAMSFVTRIPSLFVKIVDSDEAMYANAARGILKGLVLYRDVIDQKPPVIYYLYAFFLSIVNDVRFVHLVTVLIVWVTAIVIYRLVAACYDRWSGMVAGILYTLFVSNVGMASNTEIFMNLPVVLGVFYVVARTSSGRWPWHFLVAGMFVGLATLIKQQAIVVMVPLCVIIVMRGMRGSRDQLIRSLCAMIAGAVVIYIPWIIYFWTQGSLGDFITWAYISNFSYAAPESSMGYILGKALLIAILLPNFILWWFALKRIVDLRRKKKMSRSQRDLLIFGIVWLGATVYAVCMGARFYTHYFVQLTPVLVFLAAPPIATMANRLGSMHIVRRIVFLVFLFGPAVGFLIFHSIKAGMGRYDCLKPSILQTSAFVREHSKSDERIFTWGTPLISYLADRGNASRFVNVAFVFENRDPCYMGAHDDVSKYEFTEEFAVMMRDLRMHRPAMVVDTARSGIHCWGNFPLHQFAQLESFIRDNYDLVAGFGGLRVYERRR